MFIFDTTHSEKIAQALGCLAEGMDVSRVMKHWEKNSTLLAGSFGHTPRNFTPFSSRN